MVPQSSLLLIVLVHQLPLLIRHKGFLFILTIKRGGNFIFQCSSLTPDSFGDYFLIYYSGFKV